MNENALVPLADTMQLGKVLAMSGFFADAASEAKAVVKVLAGRELGFGPVASMTGINVIQGRVSLSANLMAAAIKRSGRYTYRVRKLDDQECSIEFFEVAGGKAESIGLSTFTSAQARTAGTKNMDKFPRNMLFARAMSNGVRWYCPDVTGGPVYTPEELGATVNEEGEIIEAHVTTVSEPPALPPDADNGHDADAEFAAMPSASKAAEKPHWIDNQEARSRFWAWCAQHDLNKTDVHAALKVAHVQDFTGDMGQAKTLLTDYYNARVDAQLQLGQEASA